MGPSSFSSSLGRLTLESAMAQKTGKTGLGLSRVGLEGLGVSGLGVWGFRVEGFGRIFGMFGGFQFEV